MEPRAQPAPVILTGVDAIDEQHQHFVSLVGWVNDLSPAELETAAGRALLAELVNYAAFHFAFEQNMMREAGYPDAAVHVAEHEAIAAQLHAHVGKPSWKAGDHTRFMTFLWRWFVDHAEHRDREFAEFARGRTARSRRT